MQNHIQKNDNTPLSICVYCAARESHNPIYKQIATDVGHWIGEHGLRLVYGGGSTGLMGAVADAALEAGAQVLGIIPKRLMTVEFGHHEITELRVVQDMHERKQEMIKASNAFLALPGGIGTFEEFFEAWTWCQLGYHSNPVGLLNTNGYYDGLLQFTQNCIEEGYMSQQQIEMLTIDTEAPSIMNRIYEKITSRKES